MLFFQGLHVISTIVYFFSILMIIATALPLFNSKKWWIRIFDFPRLQIFVISLFLILIFVLANLFSAWLSYAVFMMLVLTAIYQAWHIYPYTVFANEQVKSCNDENENDDALLLITANVQQENRNTEKCITMIKKYAPDVLLLIEVDDWWLAQLTDIHSHYPYTISYPLDNTHGMILMSKMEVIEPEVKFLVSMDVPSIHCRVKTAKGHLIKLICLHPVAPAPSIVRETSRSSLKRDSELLCVAKLLSATNDPVIVMGDLNDVAWSKTNFEFQSISGLLDPRRGRGLFNTFHAKSFFFRFPIDYIFHSKHFSCVSIKRLEPIDSDHFPIFIKVAF